MSQERAEEGGSRAEIEPARQRTVHRRHDSWIEHVGVEMDPEPAGKPGDTLERKLRNRCGTASPDDLITEVEALGVLQGPTPIDRIGDIAATDMNNVGRAHEWGLVIRYASRVEFRRPTASARLMLHADPVGDSSSVA
jgi:hypothetical protein